MRKYITKASERIGVESTSRDGKRAQVVSYSTCENFIIRFCDILKSYPVILTISKIIL